MKERIMNSFKYFAIILASIVFVSTAFAADGEYRQQHGAKLPITQDWRKQALTPKIARDLAHRRAEIKASHDKFISITDHDIANSHIMPESVKQSISGGAYINAANEHGNTFLHLICEALNMNLALQFIEYGAKLLPNKAGVYPQDLMSNQHLTSTRGNCTDPEIEMLRAYLIDEERKYSGPSSNASRNKKSCKRK